MWCEKCQDDLPIYGDKCSRCGEPVDPEKIKELRDLSNKKGEDRVKTDYDLFER